MSRYDHKIETSLEGMVMKRKGITERKLEIR